VVLAQLEAERTDTDHDHIMRTARVLNPLTSVVLASSMSYDGCTTDIPLTRRTFACAQVSEAACGGDGRQSYKRGVVFSWSKIDLVCEYIKVLG